MGRDRFDVLVVGSGPAGSIAATVLARNGAKVALVDKTRFPRPKACGDLIGPRGVQVLAELAIDTPRAATVDDMIVVGPTGRTVRLPCFPGRTYPGHAVAIPRLVFDDALRKAAISAGAHPFTGRADEPIFDGGVLGGFVVSGGPTVLADTVIGADGATSRVAEVTGLVDPTRALWGFAIRAYAHTVVTQPEIHFWEPRPRRALPGYGWAFPGPNGEANVGLGVGVLTDRSGGAQATRRFAAFLDHLSERRGGPIAASSRLGGWLKIGMVGTVPAAGRVLLVGDAAGLVNPLQGEGISQALRSGRAAAEAVLSAPADPGPRYRAFLTRTLGPYLAITAAAHKALLPRPRAVSTAARLLTSPAIGPALSGGWSIFWNDLLEGAQPGAGRAVAYAADRAGRALTVRSETRRWLENSLANPPRPPGPSPDRTPTAARS